MEYPPKGLRWIHAGNLAAVLVLSISTNTLCHDASKYVSWHKDNMPAILIHCPDGRRAVCDCVVCLPPLPTFTAYVFIFRFGVIRP